MSIALLPGHGNKPAGWDLGAISPAGWTEAELVRDIAASTWSRLQGRRVACDIVATGSYADRGRAAAHADLIVQLHADASPAETGPDVARIFYWPAPDGEESAGQQPAHDIASVLQAVLPWHVEVHEADEDWPNVRACLAAVGPPSVLVEVGFTDGAQGRALLPGLVEPIASALAEALAGLD